MALRISLRRMGEVKGPRVVMVRVRWLPMV